MPVIPEIIPVTDLRQGARDVINRLRGSLSPLVITQRGRAAAVMLSMEAYEKSVRERQILEQLVMGEKEIAAGEGTTLDELLTEADAVLEQ